MGLERAAVKRDSFLFIKGKVCHFCGKNTIKILHFLKKFATMILDLGVYQEVAVLILGYFASANINIQD